MDLSFRPQGCQSLVANHKHNIGTHMVDVHTSEQRSHNMALIRGRDSKPEMIVRRLIHRLVYRYCLHRRDLPGTPDLVFPKHRKIIMVHGCFWHMHSCRWGDVTPRTNVQFWQLKRSGNVKRDHVVLQRLRDDGWQILTIWECQSKNVNAIQKRIVQFLGMRGK